jgi:chaperonin cofactor prefoldin
LILLDNINSLLGDDLRKTLEPGTRLRIAASCFSIYAWEALKKELEAIESLEFVFTSPSFIEAKATDPVHKEKREFYIPILGREHTLCGGDFEIQLKNKLTQKAIARECADWIRRKARFRSNRSAAPMQQFAIIEGQEQATVYQPLHGFTSADLGYQPGNAVSNIVTRMDETSHSTTFLQLFEQIWADPERLEDVSARLADYIATVYQENSPERIYFLTLYNIFNEFLEDLEEEQLPNDRTGYQDTLIWKKLFNFQRDAAVGIINKLEVHNGCILADSVGLGKTFTALAVVKYYELRNRSVLVLCPKKLADNWVNYNKNLKTNPFAKDRFAYDVLCHTDLQRTRGESLGIPLDRVNWGNYDLVVIDESHNFRNNDAFKDRETRYQKLLNSVIRDGVKTKVLMLSATPVNNRFQDLRNQLSLAWEGGTADLGGKLAGKDIDVIFRNAQTAFNRWSKLPAVDRTAAAILQALDFDFFELLDSVTIARSRRHLETFYDTSEIGKFPERRKPMSLRAPLTRRMDVPKFDEIFDRLSCLNLSVYAPVGFILPSRLRRYEELYDTEVRTGGGKLRQADRERSLQALMTINLLKRLESSVASFRLTLRSLLDNHIQILSKIERFQNGNKESFEDISPDLEERDEDEDEFPLPGDASVGKSVRIELADMDVPSWKRDLEADRETIELLLAEMEKVTPEDDAKLQDLKERIQAKIECPINPGNRKILLFTAFADTAKYLYQHLAPWLRDQHGLNTGMVSGSSDPQSTLRSTAHPRQGFGFQEILTLFAPRAKEKESVLPDEPGGIDLLIATDCISEGQNLQDCDTLINYDIHWNPVRIIQRFGRIDRIGSPNASIQLVNYWPDITLDAYIHLKDRVETRMVIADVTATGDDNILTAQAQDTAFRKEQLRKLQEEIIELEDLKTGVNITDLGLNEFRMDLLNHVKTHSELGSAATGMHAVIPAQPERGLHPGIIFTLRNRNHGIYVGRRNRLHPFYLVYVGDDGQILADHLQVKRLLDLARLGCKGKAEPNRDAYDPFNRRTQDGRRMEACSALLDRAIASLVQAKEESELDSLFSSPRTLALGHAQQGLNDFELVTFLVVQAAP